MNKPAACNGQLAATSVADEDVAALIQGAMAHRQAPGISGAKANKHLTGIGGLRRRVDLSGAAVVDSRLHRVPWAIPLAAIGHYAAPIRLREPIACADVRPNRLTVTVSVSATARRRAKR